MSNEFAEQNLIPERLTLNYKDYPETPTQSSEITIREYLQDRVDVYRDIVLFMRNLDHAASAESETGEVSEAKSGYTEVFKIVETALGTMRAYEWSLICGINPDYKGQQFTYADAQAKAQEKYQTTESVVNYSDVLRGVAVLKSVYGEALVLDPNLEAKVRNSSEETFTANAIQYVRNRIEIQKAIETDDVLHYAEEMYNADYIDTFKNYYRLGNYADNFAYPVSGTGVVVYPHHAEVTMLETFLEEFTGNEDFGISRYDWNFKVMTDRRRVEDSGVVEALKNSAKFKILRYKYRHDLLNLVAKASSDDGNAFVSPDKMSVVTRWCAAATEQPDASDTQLDSLMAEQLSLESGKAIKPFSVYSLRMSLSEGAEDDTAEMQTYFTKKALGELLASPEKLEPKAGELRALILNMLTAYHKNGINVKDIALDLDMPRSFLNGLKRAFEKISVPELGVRERTMKVVELFEQEIWPEDQANALPTVITELAKVYSSSDINVSVSEALHTVLANHPGLKLNHQEIRNIFAVLLDKVPERMDYPEFRIAKQRYYLDRLGSLEEIVSNAKASSESQEVSPVVVDSLINSLPVSLEHIKLLRKYVELKEAGRNTIEIDDELGYDEAQLRGIINGIISEAKAMYGPIPSDKLYAIKQKVKESYSDAN